jgi:hypothetical protein
MINEMRVYDKHGNLKKTFSKKVCQARFWREFHDLTPRKHTPEGLVTLRVAGISALRINRSRVRTCLNCQKKFKGPATSKFCTYTAVTDSKNNCKLLYYEKKAAGKRIKHKPIACKMCKKDFIPKAKSSRFCNSPCVTELYRQSQVPATRTHECGLCKNKFEVKSTRGNVVYCRQPCTYALKRKQKRQEDSPSFDIRMVTHK